MEAPAAAGPEDTEESLGMEKPASKPSAGADNAVEVVFMTPVNQQAEDGFVFNRLTNGAGHTGGSVDSSGGGSTDGSGGIAESADGFTGTDEAGASTDGCSGAGGSAGGNPPVGGVGLAGGSLNDGLDGPAGGFGGSSHAQIPLPSPQELELHPSSALLAPTAPQPSTPKMLAAPSAKRNWLLGLFRTRTGQQGRQRPRETTAQLGHSSTADVQWEQQSSKTPLTSRAPHSSNVPHSSATQQGVGDMAKSTLAGNAPHVLTLQLHNNNNNIAQQASRVSLSPYLPPPPCTTALLRRTFSLSPYLPIPPSLAALRRNTLSPGTLSRIPPCINARTPPARQAAAASDELPSPPPPLPLTPVLNQVQWPKTSLAPYKSPSVAESTPCDAPPITDSMLPGSGVMSAMLGVVNCATNMATFGSVDPTTNMYPGSKRPSSVPIEILEATEGIDAAELRQAGEFREAAGACREAGEFREGAAAGAGSFGGWQDFYKDCLMSGTLNSPKVGASLNGVRKGWWSAAAGLVGKGSNKRPRGVANKQEETRMNKHAASWSPLPKADHSEFHACQTGPEPLDHVRSSMDVEQHRLAEGYLGARPAAAGALQRQVVCETSARLGGWTLQLVAGAAAAMNWWLLASAEAPEEPSGWWQLSATWDLPFRELPGL